MHCISLLERIAYPSNVTPVFFLFDAKIRIDQQATSIMVQILKNSPTITSNANSMSTSWNSAPRLTRLPAPEVGHNNGHPSRGEGSS